MFHPSIHAQTNPGKPAYLMAGSGEALTYRELDARSNQGAQLFRALGLQHGDHIASLMENCLPFMEVCWAAQRCGLFFTAISRYLAVEEIAHVVADCGARVLVVSAAVAQALAADAVRTIAGPARVFVAGDCGTAFPSWSDAVSLHPATPLAGFDMLYSSGTTGKPKGVKPPLQTKPITALVPIMQVLVVDMLGVGTESAYLSPAPLYHAAPLRFAMTAAAMGGTVIVMERFDPEAFIDSAAWQTHRGSVGRAFVGKLKITGDETGEELPPRAIGNVYFADGPSFEYNNSPEKTRAAHNAQGWSTLGDIGYVDGEGYLYLTDRKST